ncbi:MAG: hypothetical protein J6M05_01365 [Cardiobacteriaceae bacterium]|nr:hypothetical protein [Cardiobacteriaceae bacterium]
MSGLLKKISRIFLFIFIFAVMIFAAWVSLHLSSSVQFKSQESIVLSERQKAQLQELNRDKSKLVSITIYNEANPRIVKSMRTVEQEIRSFLPEAEFRLVNISSVSEDLKRHNIRNIGEVYVEIAGEGKKLPFASSEGILRAVFELLNDTSFTAVHLQGFGERAISADTSGSWRDIYGKIATKTLQFSALDLKQTINIPENAAFAVIADSQNTGNAAAHLNAALASFIAQGGSLLWTTDTDTRFLPPVLAEICGCEILDGVVVDIQSKELGFADPRLIPAEISSKNPLTADIEQLPLLPGAVAFDMKNKSENSAWQIEEILRSSAQSWNETEFSTGKIALDGEEKRGPLTLGLEISRDFNGKKQRIIILGDSDLFSREAMSSGGNLDLARNIFAHLAPEAGLEQVNKTELTDQYLRFSEHQELLLALVMILLLPFLALFLGWLLRFSFQQKYTIKVVDKA